MNTETRPIENAKNSQPSVDRIVAITLSNGKRIAMDNMVMSPDRGGFVCWDHSNPRRMFIAPQRDVILTEILLDKPVTAGSLPVGPLA